MYPNKITDKIYQQNRVKMFLQAKQWMDFLSTMDLSVGSRMHGNIAAIQAGTPSIIIPHGTRMQELIDYHKLPNITPENLKKCKSISDVIERVDFDSMYKCHEENFTRYKKFLEINGVDSIFRNSDYIENAPYDTALSKIDTDFEIKSVVCISQQELVQRWVEIYDSNNKIKQDLKNDLKALNSQFNLLNKSSIKRDVVCLTDKICDKIKGEKKTNVERVLKIKEKNKR